MRWTTDTPTEPGDYRWRVQGRDRRGLCSIYRGGASGTITLVEYGSQINGMGVFILQRIGGTNDVLEWAGPIPEPGEG